jgi:hypothetical protein
LVLVVRVPADPSRHRVAVWRELRKVGAVPLGQAVWAVPDAPVFTDGVSRVVDLAHRGDGDVTTLAAVGQTDSDAARLEGLFTDDRQAQWVEFVADCGKFDAEIDREIATGKFTLAELDEEEHSLDRLRRWHRELRARDIFGAPAVAEADQALKHCAVRLADYTDRVFRHLHEM